MKYFLIFIQLLFILNSYAQQTIQINPEPCKITLTKKHFILSQATTIYFDSLSKNTADFFVDFIKKYYHFTIPAALNNNKKFTKSQNTIFFFSNANTTNKSAYQLDVAENKIQIKGGESGVFYGMQSLIQLLPFNHTPLSIPALKIVDSPRFEYRGLHLDVGRHFFGVDFIKKYIDFMALHKLNKLHWHLTEDQGWRIEIKKYPELTNRGSCRNQTLVGPYGSGTYDQKKYCGYYTQEEIKDIINYASKRFIDIIPEIEMPGHCMAALASYPYLGCKKGPYEVMQTWGVSNDVFCAGNDSTFIFLQNVLEEIISLFPSKYIHIGGDECPKERWHECTLCQKRMQENHLKNESELQSYFMKRMETFINSKGKKIIGWDEILEGGLAPNALVMSWRGEEGGIAAANQGHFAIMTPGNPLYFDHSQSINEDSLTQGGFNSIKSVYEYDPIPKELSTKASKLILGAQANMWTEYMDNEKKVEYMLFPRISALAEILWIEPQNKHWKNFENKIPSILKRYSFWNINYSKAFYDIETKTLPNLNSKGLIWKLKAKVNGGNIFYKRPGSDDEIKYKTNIIIDTPGIWTAVFRNPSNDKISAPIQCFFHLNKATGKQITLKNQPNKNYALGGAFALVDGIQNNAGMSKSAQFLGFSGEDLNAVIDLQNVVNIDSIKLHLFEQKASWIYQPKYVEFSGSLDNINFYNIDIINPLEGSGNLIYQTKKNSKFRYIKIFAKNLEEIPSGMPGAGNKSWLFADEIEIF